MLKKVMIRSSLTAAGAEKFIQDAIDEYSDTVFHVGYTIIVENATAVGTHSSYVYYTVIVELRE